MTCIRGFLCVAENSIITGCVNLTLFDRGFYSKELMISLPDMKNEEVSFKRFLIDLSSVCNTLMDNEERKLSKNSTQF
jgi:hypothetical protein